MCEDYPCCGHTMDDPCDPQPYDAPDYYDTSLPGQEHRLCDHESGECSVDYDDEPEECDYCGSEDHCSERCPDVDDDRYHGPYEDAAMEFGLFGSET